MMKVSQVKLKNARESLSHKGKSLKRNLSDTWMKNMCRSRL